MSIPVNKYVDISTQYTSTRAINKSLSMRIYTDSENMPSGTVLEVSSLTQVGGMFDTASDDYKKASRYFNFTTLQGKSPSLLSFYKYDAVDASAFVMGSPIASDIVTQLHAITAGSLTLNFGAEKVLSDLDFSAVADIASAIAIIQAKWVTGTISLDPVLNKIKFTLTATGETATTAISGTGALITALGLDAQVISQGAVASTVGVTLQTATNMNDNYASFVFPSLTEDSEIIECSVFANASNSAYLFSVDVTSLEPTFLSQIAQSEGTVVNYDTLSENTCVIPCAVLASTDFTANDGSERYMFVIVAGMPATVTDSTYLELDSNNINYYGQTSKSGTKYSFYQDGVISGNAKYIEIYAGEMFVKDDLQGKLLQLLLNTRRLPASPIGTNLVLNTIIGSVQDYLSSGIIEPRTLTSKESISILASYSQKVLDEVTSNGYSVIISIDGTTINYTLVYLSFAGVRSIVGSHNVVGV